MTSRFLFFLGGFFSILFAATVQAGPLWENSDDEWQEENTVFPPVPDGQQWLSFDAGPVTPHRFFVDAASVAVGEDGVVRYVLLVETRAGSRNVSFEGIRCSARKWRLYGSLRSDANWGRSRDDSWNRLTDGISQRHRLALFSEYFCPGGVIVRSAEEALDALRKGGHPDNHLW